LVIITNVPTDKSKPAVMLGHKAKGPKKDSLAAKRENPKLLA